MPSCGCQQGTSVVQEADTATGPSVSLENTLKRAVKADRVNTFDSPQCHRAIARGAREQVRAIGCGSCDNTVDIIIVAMEHQRICCPRRMQQRQLWLITPDGETIADRCATEQFLAR